MSIHKVSGRSLVNLILISLLAGWIGGLTCALFTVWLPSAIGPACAPYLLILFTPLQIVVLFWAIYFWGVVSRRYIRRYGEKFE